MKFNPLKITPERLPLISTAVICLALYVFAAIRYEDFFSLPMGMSLIQDKASLGVMAVGMTFVILSGGIDLSVGAVLGWSTIFFASLVMHFHLHPLAAMAVILAMTTVIGGVMGGIIHFFKIPAFLVTLAGLFFYHGVALLISTRQISINHPFLFNREQIENLLIVIRPSPARGVAEVDLRPETWVMAAVFLFAILASRYTAFGRSIYAIGGNEQSALLMGLPVARNKILTYAISGFCAGLAGLMSMLTSSAGDPLRGEGFELQAIAVVVVGGTLLTGGSGSVMGTYLGLLIVGIIDNIVVAQHFKSSAWPRIAIGVLLLAFILLQKLLQFRRKA